MSVRKSPTRVNESGTAICPLAGIKAWACPCSTMTETYYSSGDCFNMEVDILSLSAHPEVTLQLTGNDDWNGKLIQFKFVNKYQFNYANSGVMNGPETKVLGPPTGDYFRYL